MRDSLSYGEFFYRCQFLLPRATLGPVFRAYPVKALSQITWLKTISMPKKHFWSGKLPFPAVIFWGGMSWTPSLVPIACKLHVAGKKCASTFHVFPHPMWAPQTVGSFCYGTYHITVIIYVYGCVPLKIFNICTLISILFLEWCLLVKYFPE